MKQAIAVLLFALVVFTFMGCGGSVVGTYKSSFGNIELMENGNFRQDFGNHEGGKYEWSVAGPYEVEGSDVKVWFEQGPYPEDINTTNKIKSKGAPTRVYKVKGDVLTDTEDDTVYAK